MHIIFDNKILDPARKQCTRGLAHPFIDKFNYPLWCMLIKLAILQWVRGFVMEAEQKNKQTNPPPPTY